MTIENLDIVPETVIKHNSQARRLWIGFITGLRAMSQTISDAWNQTFLAIVAGLVIAGVPAAIGFAVWTAMAVGGMQADISAMKGDVAAIKQVMYERPAK